MGLEVYESQVIPTFMVLTCREAWGSYADDVHELSGCSLAAGHAGIFNLYSKVPS